MSNTAYKKITSPAAGAPSTGRTVVDNRNEKISERLNAILHCVWELNDQEKSYLDRHFLLVRTVDDLVANYLDNHHLGGFLVNGGISYYVIFNGISDWSELKGSDKIRCSFRWNRYNRLAVVIVRRALEKAE